MELKSALDAYFFSKELQPRSREWYAAKLTAFIAWCQEHTCTVHQNQTRQVEDLQTTHVREYLNHLQVTPSSALNHVGTPPGTQTVHGYARAIRAWLNWCIGEDLVAERVTKRLEMPKREQNLIAIFTNEQIAELLAACKTRYTAEHYRWLAERDKTILAVLLDTGIRASELCDLTMDRVRLGQESSYIVVNGKGLKQREIGVGTRTRQQLHRYIYRFRPSAQVPYVFLTRQGTRLHSDGLSGILYQLKLFTGIKGVRCTPHDFRHTFAYNYMQAGGDVLHLSRILGHTSLTVTAEYLRSFQSRDARQAGISVLDGMFSRKD